MAGKLRQITSTFNIFDHARTTHNNRRYLLKAVKRIIAHPKTQEKLKLGELYGYFGHGKRTLSNKLHPDELEIVTINGKSVVLDQSPACYCVALDIDDKGNLTHTEQLIDNEAGRGVDAMEAAKAGGWSWATSGSPSNIIGFGGFDYVKVPSYISKEKQSLMMESVNADSIEDLMLQNLINAGIDEQGSQLMLESWNSMPVESPEANKPVFDLLMLESMLEEQKSISDEKIESLQSENQELKDAISKRSELMLEAVESLPVFMTDEQRSAFSNLASNDDLSTVKLMFESLTDAAKTLPFGNDKSHEIVHLNSPKNTGGTGSGGYMNFNQNANPFSGK